MEEIKKNIKQLFLRLGLAFLIFSIARLLFLLFNKSYFPDINYNVLFYGLRFDLVSICYLYSPFILLHVIPLLNYKVVWREKALRLLFHLGSSIGLFLNLVDVIYYNFIFKRSTFDLFDAIGNDGARLLPAFIKDFWFMIPIYIGIVIGVDFLYKKTIKITFSETHKKQFVFKIFLFIIVVILTMIGARGGTQLKPLSIPDGGKYTVAQNIPVLFNTPFTLLLSVQIDTEKELIYYEPDILSELYTPIQTIEGKGKYKGKNIVFIILESFASEYIGYYNRGKGYTPFLDSLFKKSYVFDNNRSNGLRSVEALPAMLAGIPNLNNTPYILSLNATNKLYALPHRLKELGYNTSFYHGGENGTMGFDAFCGLAGIDAYFGINEYPYKKRDYDGNWGIYDEPYLQYFAEELKSKKEPFFSSVFTLSSHHPYSIPKKYKNKFKKGNKKVIETIGYTDFSLSQFFKSIQEESWYKNTLFVITADHPAQPISKYYIKDNGKYKVPLAFFDPTGKLKGRTFKNAKHSDLPSTLLGLLGDSVKLLNFGEDLFLDQESFCVNQISNNYNFRLDGLLVQFNGGEVTGAFLESDSLLLYNLKDSLNYKSQILFIENKGKAYIQQYSTRIKNNQLTPTY